MPRGSCLLDVESRGYLTFPPLFPQAELTGAVSELDALLPEMGSDAHRRSLAAPLHLSFRPEPVRRSQVRQLGRRRRVRDPATEQEPRRPRREVHLLMRDVESVWRWARMREAPGALLWLA